jgi:phosphopantothenoylcysteine decarboxylase/phosphopantothenate--cysteine ligase
MGFALALEAARRGAQVTTIAANVALPRSSAISYVDVESAEDLRRAVVERFAECDVLLMAAAVADYRPAAPTRGKIDKEESARLEFELERTPDVLSSLARERRPDQLVVGFAAEHGAEAVERARAKLERKNLDAIVVNDISRTDIGFDALENEVTILDGAGAHPVAHGPKEEIAAAVLDHVIRLRAEVPRIREPGKESR